MEKKLRIDKVLTLRGFFKSRSKALDAIKRGLVIVDGKRITKGGVYIEKDKDIQVVDDHYFVSRGALKLKKVIEEFNIDVNGKICLDIGAGTGGFTEILLFYNAKKVYAVDVGNDILDKNLRSDERVIVKENLNAKYLTRDDIPEDVDIITHDTSFISSKKILLTSKNFLKLFGDYILLVKPQFELDKKLIKNGVVLDLNLHFKVLKDMMGFVIENGFHPIGLIPSPIKGKDGNIEYLLYMKKINDILNLNDFSIDDIVNQVILKAKGSFYEDRNNL